jgi:hypothetical protein
VRADLGVTDQGGTGSVKRSPYRRRKVQRRETVRVKRHDTRSEALGDRLEVGPRKPVRVRRDTRPEGSRHLAGTERTHRRDRRLHNSGHEPPPACMRNAKNTLRARQADRRAVGRQHHERRPCTGADGGIRFFGPAISGLLHDHHAMAMYLAEPGPGGIRQRALCRKSARLSRVCEVTCAAAPGAHLGGPGQSDRPGPPWRRRPVGACRRAT